MLARIIASLALILTYNFASLLWSATSTLMVGKIAGQQLEPSDGAFLASVATSHFFSGTSVLPLLLLVVVLIAIWFSTIKRALLPVILLLPLAFIAAPQPASAYYDKTDYTENFFILPNESAFYIPDVGDNKNSQVAFGSTAYMQANKIAAKRFQIPHVTLSNSGMFSNYVVPAGRLIVLDRSAFNREWTGKGRGTSAEDQAFPCQSSEGIDITAEITIGASISEDNAATYLAHFGIEPPKGDRNDPNVIFTSVFHARSLASVMDTVGRGEVQALVCRELTKKLDDANAQQATIMDSVRKETAAYLQSYGITLEYMGWGGTFQFDKVVQDAINNRFAAEKVAPVMATLQSKGAIETMQKWNGAIPPTSGFMFLPTGFMDAVSGWFGKK